MSAASKLAALIRARLLGVRPEDQDLVLEDHDWRLILAALVPVAETAGEAVARDKLVAALADALAFIDDMGTDLHRARVADWYPEGAHNAASQMSEDMRLAGNRCATYESLVDLNEAIANPTVSAQDDDKLRIADADSKWLTRLLGDQKEGGHCGEGNVERRERSIWNDRIDRILAALKSTAAQEGGRVMAEDQFEYEDEIECPVCKGFGFLETDDGTVECDECDGNGSVAP